MCHVENITGHQTCTSIVKTVESSVKFGLPGSVTGSCSNCIKYICDKMTRVSTNASINISLSNRSDANTYCYICQRILMNICGICKRGLLRIGCRGASNYFNGVNTRRNSLSYFKYNRIDSILQKIGYVNTKRKTSIINRPGRIKP